MSFVLKISKRGYDVLDPKAPKSNKPVGPKMPHLLYAVAITYLDGATTQLERYRVAAVAQIADEVMTTYRALHELSNLFEDLATLAKYTNECGHHHDLNQLLVDIRNHIRHDVRENFDNDDVKLKVERAKRLGIDEAYQTQLGFDHDAIRVGAVTLTLKEISDYLAWAASTIDGVMSEAYKKGYIKGGKN